MATAKSPFLIFEDFLTPKQCEQIVDDLDFYSPDTNQDGKPIKSYKFKESCQQLIFNRFQPLIDNIVQYYETQYRGTEQITFEYFAQGTAGQPLCENSDYLRKKWVRTKNHDLTGVVFLCDYNENVPYDGEYEVYGGKLEFPQHGFGFNPQRGTLIMYPSGPHFINATNDIICGDLVQARIHVATKTPFLYNPAKFPGNYKSWFQQHLN